MVEKGSVSAHPDPTSPRSKSRSAAADAVVAVTRGTMKHLRRHELEGVIAHELSHIKNYDILVQTLAVVMVGVIVLLSDWILRTFLWGGGRRPSTNDPTSFSIFLVSNSLRAIFCT